MDKKIMTFEDWYKENCASGVITDSGMAYIAAKAAWDAAKKESVKKISEDDASRLRNTFFHPKGF